jgi:hypothetical protein
MHAEFLRKSLIHSRSSGQTVSENSTGTQDTKGNATLEGTVTRDCGGRQLVSLDSAELEEETL